MTEIRRGRFLDYVVYHSNQAAVAVDGLQTGPRTLAARPKIRPKKNPRLLPRVFLD